MRWRLLCLGMLLLCACSIGDRRTGVINHWRAADFTPFEVGVTDKARVLAALGPPSFAMELHERTVLYYVSEHADTWGLNLVVYRQEDTEVRFDRAMYVFGPDEILESQSYSREQLPYPEEEDEEDEE